MESDPLLNEVRQALLSGQQAPTGYSLRGDILSYQG